MFEYPDMRNESKTVTEGEKRRDINNLGVKMADRWMAAGRKSLCQIYKSFGFVEQKDS